MKSGQPSGSLTQEIEKGVLFGFESTNVSTVRPVESCVPVSVERLEKDKDADENVDADQIRTGRPVKSGQSIGLFTQREEIDIEQNNVYNPFSDDSKAMIREMGNVELFELCETIPKAQCSECLLYWNQGIVYCTCGQLLRESESRQKFSPMATGCSLHPALRHQKGETSRCSARQN